MLRMYVLIKAAGIISPDPHGLCQRGSLVTIHTGYVSGSSGNVSVSHMQVNMCRCASKCCPPPDNRT